MGHIARAVSAIAEQRSVTSSAKPAAWLLDLLGGGPTKSGTRVSEKTAVRVSTVFSCVRIISEDTSGLPLHLYERIGEDDRRRATDHRLYGLITDAANPEQPMKAFRELLTAHTALWGDGFAEIEQDNAGRPIAFWPLLPDRTRAVRKGGTKFVVTDLPNGRTVGLPPGQYLHIPGPSWLKDGLSGENPIRLAREAIGLAAAGEEYGARLFGQGARPSGVLTTEKKLSPEAKERLKQEWDDVVSGISNQHRTALLEENLKWQQISMDADKAQSLESRKFQVEEVARYYRMPLVLLGHTEKSTSWGTGIEQFLRGYLTYTLGSWLTRWETWLPHHLLTPEERRAFYVEHVLEDFLKGDIATRFEAYAKAVQNGWMNRNEVRRRENMRPIEGEGGDVYTVQINMASLDDIAGGGLDLRSLLDGTERRSLAEPPAPPFNFVAGAETPDPVTISEPGSGMPLVLHWTDLAGLDHSDEIPLQLRPQGAPALDPDRRGRAEDVAREKARELAAARRSLTARRRLRRKFQDVFEQVFGRATRREVAALRRLAKRLDEDADDTLSPEAFLEEVAGFYELEALREGKEISGHMAWLDREYRKPLGAYAELLQAEVLEERGETEVPDSAAVDVFVVGYVGRFLRRHAARSHNQMKRLVEKTVEKTVERAMIQAVVEERLDEWEERRPEKMGAEQSVHSGGSIARITYFGIGVLSIQWVTFGENCPLCEELNGQVVGIQEVFLEKGDRVEPDDDETQPLETKRAILHPPLHLGCDCDVVAA